MDSRIDSEWGSRIPPRDTEKWIGVEEKGKDVADGLFDHIYPKKKANTL